MAKQQFSRAWKILIISGMLIFGTVTVVAASAMFQIKSKGINGKKHKFRKPSFETLAMFIGMFLCLFVHWGTLIVKKIRGRKNGEEPSSKSINSEAPIKSRSALKKEIKQYLLVAIPASCDMVATVLMYIGLMFTTASVFQIMRGFMVVCSAVLSIFFLKRRLRPYKWLSVAIVILGLAMVGMALVLDPTHAKKKGGSPAIGLLFIIGAQLIQATQVVLEEVLMKNVDAPPLLIVGMEGFWGILEMIIVLTIMYFLPGPDVGHKLENTLDTFVQIGNSAVLFSFVMVYFVAILFYNYFGMCVTQAFSAVHRTILEAVRTSCIWVVNLFLWYVVTRNADSRIGEWWTDWSVLELGGFVVVFVGTLLYNDILIIPGMNYKAYPPRTSKK